jgi:FkbM family methyltransferase
MICCLQRGLGVGIRRRFFSPAAYARRWRDETRRRAEMRVVAPNPFCWILRSFVRPVYQLPCTIVTRAGMRYRLEADPIDDAILRHMYVRPGLYFPDVAGFVPRGVVLDVGAHHGFYAIEALRRYRDCRMIAVEPDPAACRALHQNIALNGLEHRIRIVQGALADRPGVGRVERNAEGSWATHVRPATRRQDDETARAQVMTELLTLADILGGQQPELVKCNAEGAEFALVPQMIALGLRPALIVLMAHPAFGSAGHLVQQLQNAGYDVRDADEPPAGHRFHCTRLSTNG